jgi:hypothetical protein
MKSTSGSAKWAALVLIAAILGVAVSGAGASSLTQPAKLHILFRRVGEASSVVTDGRFAFINSAVAQDPARQSFSGGLLVDTALGRRTRVPQRGCFAVGLSGAQWVLFSCPQKPAAYEVYSLLDHKVHRRIDATTGLIPVAVGSHWVQLFATSTGTVLFESIRSGVVRALPAWRAGGTLVPDLSSAALGRKLCSPLRVPSDWTAYAAWTTYPHNEKLHAGTVTFFGRSAILQGTTRPDGDGSYSLSTYIERCGSGVRSTLGGIDAPVNAAQSNFVANSSIALIGGGYAGTLVGRSVATRALIVVHAPGYREGLIPPYDIALTTRTLFVIDSADQLWSGQVAAR